MLSVDEIKKLPKEAREHIATLGKQLCQRDHEIEDLQEQLKLAIFRKFGRKTESTVELLQNLLFEEPEQESPDTENNPVEAEEEKIESNNKKKRGRKPLSKDLPRVDVVHDISDEEKQCACGHELSKIDEEVSEKLKIIPEQVFVERHIRPKYSCRHCEGSGDEEKSVFRITPVEASMIPKSIVTPELLAFIIVNKFADHLPYYRQEKRFERIGARISRQDMSNWQNKAYNVLSPLKDLLKSHLLSGEVINMDETPVQVMGEEGKANTSKSYMWLARGGPPDKPVIHYEYHRNRGSDYIKDFLTSFSGFLQTDGYVGYEAALKERNDVVQIGCMAHVRRKFFEAAKGSKKAGAAQVAVSKIQKFYHIEKDLRSKKLESNEFLEKRKALIEPIAEDFKSWLDKKVLTHRPSSNFGKAVHYALSQWDKVMNYLDHSELTPDNNAAERAIRPFVLGRKNWLFSGSPEGAKSSCFMFSLIETAKQNGLNPYGYLNYIFSQAPMVRDNNTWENLLPWNIKADMLELKAGSQA